MAFLGSARIDGKLLMRNDVICIGTYSGLEHCGKVTRHSTLIFSSNANNTRACTFSTTKHLFYLHDSSTEHLSLLKDSGHDDEHTIQDSPQNFNSYFFFLPFPRTFHDRN